MIVLFEYAPPVRWKPKLERYGPLRRFIWLWFSVAYIGAGFSDMLRAMREAP